MLSIDFLTKGGTIGKVDNAGDWTAAVGAAEAFVAQGHIAFIEVTDEDGKPVYSYDGTDAPNPPQPLYLYL